MGHHLDTLSGRLLVALVSWLNAGCSLTAETVVAVEYCSGVVAAAKRVLSESMVN
jgi:hypothetical protein